MCKRYKVELDIETMQDIKDLIYFCSQHFPYTKKNLWSLERQLGEIIKHGCFKHNILRETFRTSPQESISLCKKCNPKEYAKLKKEAKKI